MLKNHPLTLEKSHLNKPVKNLSKREKDDLLKTNLDAAKKQAQLFSSRLIEVLSLDPQLQGNSNKLGLPYLPIALDASLRPGGEGDDAERNLVGEIYAESICTWINEVTREQTFAGQPIVLFTMPFIYNDFNLSRGSCGLDKIPIWISHRTLDGDREFAEKDTDNLAVIRLLCGPSKEESRCIIHQYTSFGNFALHQRSEGLDMNRFYGSEDDLWRWLQQATLY